MSEAPTGTSASAAAAVTPADTATVPVAPPSRPSVTPGVGATPTATVTPTVAATPSAATPTGDGTTAADGVALVEQAIGYLTTFAIRPPDIAELYRTAYDGAAAALREAGRAVQVADPAFDGDAGDAARFRSAYLALAEAPPAIAQAPLAYAAIRAATERVGDCNTYFLDPAEAREQQAANAGAISYAGIGVSVRERTAPAIVAEVYPGSPAERAGLRPGDALLAVDGQSVAALPFERIGALVRGPEGTAVTLVVQRPGEQQPRTFALTRARVAVPTLVAHVIAGPGDAKVGYLKVRGLSDDAEVELRRALAGFEAQGVTAWVLDLRGTAGGRFAAMARVAALFIPAGQRVGYYVRATGRQPITGQGAAIAPQRPLAVLIGGGDGGTGEILAAALRDYGVARLFGQATPGCVSVGNAHPLADGSVVNVADQMAVSPLDRDLAGIGQAPDEAIAPDMTYATDPALDAALRWLAAR